MSVANVQEELRLAGASGVTVQDFGAGGIETDLIAESTSGSGVTIDGALIKDLGISVDTINESTPGSGVTVADELIKSGGDQTLAISLADADTTLSVANSGKLHLVPNVSADRIYTLPANAAGLYYEFWSTLVAADGHDVQIIADNAADFYKGTLYWLDTNGSTQYVKLSPNGSDDHTLNIILPISFCIKMYCDGTNWFITGHVEADATPTWT